MKNKIVILALLIATLFSQGIAFSSDSKNTKRLWNLQNADIRSVIEQVSKETGKNFVIDDKVRGKITIVSSKPIDSKQVYEVFLQALQVLGYAALPHGDVIKIVPDSNARSMGLPLYNIDGEQDMVVQVIPIHNVSAPALVPILRPLMSPQGGHLGAYGTSNMLIAADHKEAIKRLVQIIKRVDIVDNDEIEIIPLHHAMASEVGDILNNLLSPKRATSLPNQQVSISADDRSNSIILSGDKTRRLRIRAVVANLDIAAPSEGNTEVIYIKYQKAEDLVPILGNVIQSYYGASKGIKSAANSNGANKRVSILSALSTLSRGGNNSTGNGSKGGEANIQAEERQGVGTVIGGFGVQADPNLNALVITAPPSLMSNVKKVINKLDKRRRQVLVEAIVVELSDDVQQQLGIDWRIPGGDVRGGFSGLGGESSLINSWDPTKKLPLAKGLNLGFIRGSSIRGVLTALETEGGTNVLATPSLIAMDNTKARMFVGETIPYATQRQIKQNENDIPIQTIDQKEVGLGLSVVPQITVDNAVQLTISQWADSEKASPNGDPLLSGTTNRSIDTHVIVNNGDIVVLGGLIRNNKIKSNNKIPILGDIPILGNAFKYKDEKTQKTNLMVFIRPLVLRDRKDSVYISGAKYNSIRSEMLEKDPFDDRDLLPQWQQALKANIPEPFLEK